MAGTDNMNFCGARRKGDGQPCRQPAMRGSTRCRMHGGSAPQVRKASQRRINEAYTLKSARRYGRPRPVTAADALEEELHRTQGHIDWLCEQVAINEDPGWMAVYQSERAHLSRLSHQIISSKADERRAVLAEQGLAALETALAGILGELGHDPKATRVRDVVARHLRSVSPLKPELPTGTVDAEVIRDSRTPPARF